MVVRTYDHATPFSLTQRTTVHHRRTCVMHWRFQSSAEVRSSLCKAQLLGRIRQMEAKSALKEESVFYIQNDAVTPRSLQRVFFANSVSFMIRVLESGDAESRLPSRK